MNIKKLLMCCALFFSINVFTTNVIAASTSIHKVAQPIPSTEMDIAWLIFPDVAYIKGILVNCSYYSDKCDKEGYEPQDVLNKKLGPGYVPHAISPFLNQYGRELGVVLYYKKDINN